MNGEKVMFEKLTSVLEDFIDQGVPGCDCVVYHKGKCVYRKFLGYSDKENKIEYLQAGFIFI